MRERPARGLGAALALLAAACGSEPRGDCGPAPRGQVGSICGFHNPEDVEGVRARGLLLVSQMAGDGAPGSLAGLELEGGSPPRILWPRGGPESSGGDGAGASPGWGDPGCPGPPDPGGFRPHGLSAGPERADGEIPLGVVAHGQREAVELFGLSGAGPRAELRWRGCVPLPAGTTGNDLELQADGSLLIANYMPTQEGLRALWYQILAGLGRDTGDVLRWAPGTGFQHLPGSAGPNPNGVLRAPDGRVFAAQTGSGRVVAIDVASGSSRAVAVAGHPDNLSRSPGGLVLVATHLSGSAFLRCAASRGPCRSPWALYAIDPESLRARELLRHDGSAVGGVASAAWIGDRIYFGAVFGDRIGVARLE